MRIIEIIALDNGAHRNQTGSFSVVPDGWAVIPDDLMTPNFPFGEVTVDDSKPPVVTGWTPGEIPEPEPTPEPETEASVWDELDAAYTAGYNEGYQEGVNTAYDK